MQRWCTPKYAFKKDCPSGVACIKMFKDQPSFHWLGIFLQPGWKLYEILKICYSEASHRHFHLSFLLTNILYTSHTLISSSPDIFDFSYLKTHESKIKIVRTGLLVPSREKNSITSIHILKTKSHNPNRATNMVGWGGLFPHPDLSPHPKKIGNQVPLTKTLHLQFCTCCQVITEKDLYQPC